MHSRTHHLRRLVCSALFLAGLSYARVAAADTFVLDWHPNSESEVSGYLVFIGTQSGNYSTTVDVGMATSYSFTSDVPGQTYYFALKAYAGAAQSPYSAEMVGVTNSAPSLAHVVNRAGAPGVATALQLEGADVDGDALTYAVDGLPPGLVLTQGTGLISGVPTTPGTYAVAAHVFDGYLWSSQSFMWTVGVDATPAPADSSAPSAPMLTNPGTQSSLAGLGLSLQLVANSVEGRPLTFSAVGLPAGLEIVPATGRITGVPSVAGTFSVVATVSDGRFAASQAFGWSVSAMSASAASAVAHGKQPRATSTTSSTAAAGTSTSTRDAAANSQGTVYTGATARVRDVSASGSTGAVVSAGGTTTRAVASSAAASTSVVSTQRRPASESLASLAAPQDSTSPAPARSTDPNDTVRALVGSAPSVRILTPVDGAAFGRATTTIFSGAADDAEDGNLAARIVWTSSLDGRIGTGATVQRQLSSGSHVVTASVVDDSGNSHNVRIVVTIAR